jgi:hypothetical protein
VQKQPRSPHRTFGVGEYGYHLLHVSAAA